MGDDEGSGRAPRSAWLLLLIPVGLVAFWLFGDSIGGDTPRGGRFGWTATTEAGAPQDRDASARASVESTGTDAGFGPSGPVVPVRLSSPTVRREPSITNGALHGTVRSWASGRPVPDAELTFSFEGTTRSVISDARGRFAFTPVDEGTYVLALAMADGFLPFAPEWGHSQVRFTARPGVILEGIVVYLVDVAPHVATVVDSNDEPVAGATLRLFGADRGEHALAPLRDTYATDAAGEARFSAPDNTVIEASHPDAGRGRARIDLAVQASHRVRIQLAPDVPESLRGDRTISGAVVEAGAADGPSAVPVSGAMIVARFDGPRGLHPERSAISDARGGFTIDGLDAGPYSLVATAEGFSRAAIDVAAGADDIAIELRPEGRLRVRVTDAESGDPIAAATVIVERRLGALEWATLGRASGYDGEGELEVRGLPRGPCRVIATSPGYAPSGAVDATAGVDPPPIEVRLSRGGTILGRVVSAGDERPLDGARVTLEGRLGSGSSTVPISSSALTDEDGRFELTGAPLGLGSVVAWAADHHGRVRSGLTVTADAPLDVGLIDLTPVEDGEEPGIELAGIGAVLSAEGDVLLIQRAVNGGGAAEAGLGEGDAILEVNGAAVGDLGFGGCIERIRGPEGTTVRLRIRRAGADESELIYVPRRRIRA